LLVSQAGTLVFVSTRFLFPVDSGGKIRTTQILRGMKGGRFRLRLLSPATPELVRKYAAELNEVCDEFQWWPQPARGKLHHFTRLRHVLHQLPIPVRTDCNEQGAELIAAALRDRPAVSVFDFLHATVLMPQALQVPSVMFTHNVEAEIFARHLSTAKAPWLRALWTNQYAKMKRFEAEALSRFDVVVAVSDRDARAFAKDYGAQHSFVIPTGVDLEFFGYREPSRDEEVVFCGSMDWLPNQDAVRFFLDEIWPRVAQEVPAARFTVVGRAPPQSLVAEAQRRGLAWRFTGFVDDVRPYVQGAAVSVIPMRIAGGTRLKVYEAMAMGSPVVSTAIGVEGLPLQADTHYLNADDAASFASAIVALLRDRERRARISRSARQYVDSNFSYKVAARAFEDACLLAMQRRAVIAPARAYG
jgi:polysaccharide biosynthesis protein PslH